MLMHLLLKSLLVPEAGIALLWLLLRRWWPQAAGQLAVSLLFISCLPVTAWLMTQSLSIPVPKVYPAVPIVVLGGGRQPALDEMAGEDGTSLDTLERLRFAALLERTLQTPLIVSGGRVMQEKDSEAQLMRQSLIRDFRISAAKILLEGSSRNTWENAQRVAAMLRPGSQIILVTSALHMRRALADFRRVGLQPVPVGVGAYHGPPWKSLWVFPSIGASTVVSSAWMEWMGLLIQGH